MCIKVKSTRDVSKEDPIEAWKVTYTPRGVSRGVSYTGPFTEHPIKRGRWLSPVITCRNQASGLSANLLQSSDPTGFCAFPTEEAARSYKVLLHDYFGLGQTLQVEKALLAGVIEVGTIPKSVVGEGTKILRSSLIKFEKDE